LKSNHLPLCIAIICLASVANAETKFGSVLSRATFKLVNPGSTATVFILTREVPNAEVDEQPDQPTKKEYLLVTANHVLAETKGERATLELRKRDESGEWIKRPLELAIRSGDKPLWTKHNSQDVAVMRVDLPKDVDCAEIPLSQLATEEDWKRLEITAGDSIRCVGYPHGNHFAPTNAGLPLLRAGCVSHLPELPRSKFPKFHCSFNIFEGDSGGAVYLFDPLQREDRQPILGVVSAQHFLDERYDLIYVKGMIRERLGMGVIVHATAVHEVIAEME
jgi:hypothetical protein